MATEYKEKEDGLSIVLNNEEQEVIDITEQEQERQRVNSRDRELAFELNDLYVQLQHNMLEWNRLKTRINTLCHERVRVSHGIRSQVRRGVQRPTIPQQETIDWPNLLDQRSSFDVVQRNNSFQRLHGMLHLCPSCLQAVRENRLVICPSCDLITQSMNEQ